MLLDAFCVAGWCGSSLLGSSCRQTVQLHAGALSFENTVVMSSSWSLALSTNRIMKTGSVLPVVSKKVIARYDNTWGFLLLFKTSEDILINVAMVCSGLACSQ